MIEYCFKQPPLLDLCYVVYRFWVQPQMHVSPRLTSNNVPYLTRQIKCQRTIFLKSFHQNLANISNMSDSDYIPDEEERTVKTTTMRKATAKTSIYASDSDYSPDEVYTVKATKTRKPTKSTTKEDIS